MSKHPESDDRNINNQLKLVESLLNEGNFQQALTEIRDLENRKVIDHNSCEEGELSYFGAFALVKLGQPNEALVKARKAYEILRNSENNRRLAQVQRISGIIYAHLGELKQAEIHFTDSASTYRRINDQNGVADIYNELARICFIRSKFPQAVEYITDALDYYHKTDDQVMIARLHGNLGTIQMLQDQWHDAEKSLILSLQTNQNLNDQHNVCKSLLSLGNLNCRLRKLPQAETYLKNALELINQNNYTHELAIYHEYQGSLEFALDHPDQARHHFQEAIRIGEEIAPQSAIISQTYRLLAELQAEKGEQKAALQSCEKSLSVSREIGEKLEEALTYRILGRLHSQNGHSDLVKENFASATQMLEEMGMKSELAKTYWEMGRCSNSGFWDRMKYLSHAEELASQLDSPYHLGCIALSFAQLFLENNQTGEASDYLQQAKSIFEQSNEKNDLKAVSDLEAKIEASKQTGDKEAEVVNIAPRAKDSNSVFSFDSVITQDQTTLEILNSVRQIKDFDITVLLEGETGTGKDLLAKVIHQTSNRKDKRFVAVTCSAIPEALFESELFGHKKGAFTGAVTDKTGLLDEAAGGTLYLDEIGEVPLPIQVKLLRAIEEKEIVRIGEVKPKKVDFRVIAATNRNLDELVQEGKFRSDLFYRLNAIRIKLPPLREKKEDIPFLVDHMLKKHWLSGMNNSSGTNPNQSKPIPDLDPKILELFSNYEWPGNIRELDNEVKRLLIACNGDGKICYDRVSRSLEKFNNLKSRSTTPHIANIDQMEKEIIEKALAKSNWVKTRAARLLNIDEALLRYKMKKWNISCSS
jgi:transcriptional regulator with PAS, ATPase and Fis domain